MIHHLLRRQYQKLSRIVANDTVFQFWNSANSRHCGHHVLRDTSNRVRTKNSTTTNLYQMNNTIMTSGISFNYRKLVLIASISMITRCSAFFLPAVRMEQRIGTKIFSTTSAEETMRNGPSLLDPKIVSQKVFSADQRPIILFDGGTSSLVADFWLPDYL